MLKKITVFILFLLFIISTESLYSQRLIKLGKEKIKNEKYKEAISILSNAIKKYPKIQNGYYLLAIAYRENNQLTESEGALLDGLAVGGDIDYKLYFELGNIMFKRGKGYYKLAIKYYTNAIKKMPNYEKSLLNRANAYVEQGKIIDKEKNYKSAWNYYTMAIHDYSQFITLKSETEKKNDILYMIKLLRDKKSDLEKLDTNIKNMDIKNMEKNIIENNKENKKIIENKNILKKNNQNKINKDHDNKINKFKNELNTNSLIELEKIHWQEELNIDE